MSIEEKITAVIMEATQAILDEADGDEEEVLNAVASIVWKTGMEVHDDGGVEMAEGVLRLITEVNEAADGLDAEPITPEVETA